LAIGSPFASGTPVVTVSGGQHRAGDLCLRR